MPRRHIDDQAFNLAPRHRFQVIADRADVPPGNVGVALYRMPSVRDKVDKRVILILATLKEPRPHFLKGWLLIALNARQQLLAVRRVAA